MCDDKLGGGFNPVTDENPAGTVNVYTGKEQSYDLIRADLITVSPDIIILPF
jgi:hypothetical protein